MKIIGQIMLVSSLIIAMNASQAEHIELDDITVTATRSEKAIIEQAASIHRKSRKEIQLEKARVQSEVLNAIAGVRITQTGSTIGHKASIRLPNSTAPYYLYLQDSIPIQSSGFFNHNGLAYTNFSSAGSVEVLKGAGTALYGSDAVGATVNVLSPSPYDLLGTELSLELGRDDFRHLGAKFGIELDEFSALSASISHAESDGWRDHSEYKRDELSVNYINDIDEHNILKLGLIINNSDAEMTSAIKDFRRFRDEPTNVGDNVERALLAGIDPIRKFDFARFNTEWEHIVSDQLQLDSIVYIRSNRNQYHAVWEQNIPKNDSEEKSIGFLLKADLDLDPLHVISGLDIEYTKATREYIQEFDFVPTRFGSQVDAGKIYDYEVNYKALAPYARLEFALTDRLTLGAGLRYDMNRYEYTNKLADGQYASSTYARASSDNDPIFHHLSPKLDILFRFSEQQSVYGRYANGFRIPQASRLYSLRTNNIDFSLDEEVTDTFEVGYKLKTKAHEFTGALYYLVIDDTIVRRENAVKERFYVNGGKTHHKGLELSLTSTLSNEFNSHIAYSLSKHKFDNDEQFFNNEQAEAPQNVANVRLVYSPTKIAGLIAMLEWQHVGSYWLDDQNTTKYKGHDLANFKLRYKVNDKLSVFSRINNITNRAYAEAATLSFGSENYTPAAPRQAYIGIDYKLF